MESDFISVVNMDSGADWQPVRRDGSGRFEFFKVRHFGALHFVKRPSEAFRHDLVTTESLKKEFYIGYNLNHPSIVRYVRMEDGAVYEEYVDGLSLREMIDNDDDRLHSPDFIERVCRQLIEAVTYLHSRGVIHNDIKPENVMISRIDNRLKLVDLGCATTDMWDATEGFTPAYKAPEQGIEDTNVYTDIFLIGRLMEELAAKAGVSRRWRGFIKKATAEDIADRFASDDEALASVPTKGSAWKWVVYVLAGLIVLIVSLWFFIGERQQSAQLADVPVDSLQVADAPSIQEAAAANDLPVEDNGVSEQTHDEVSQTAYSTTVEGGAGTIKERIDDDLLRFAVDLYNRRIIPQCKKHAKYIYGTDVEACDIRINRKTKKTESDILNHAETLARQYPDYADYCRLQASVVIDAQNRQVEKMINDNPPALQPLYTRKLWYKLEEDLDGEPVYSVSDVDENLNDQEDQWIWMNENCIYPEGARRRGVEGIVTVGLVVKKDGTVDRITIFKGLDKEIDESVIRILKNMPKWSPATIKGEPVNCSFSRNLFYEFPDD